MTSKLLNPDVEQRVTELMEDMTLAQKVGQMTQSERMATTPEDVAHYHLGSILSGGGSCPGENRLSDWVAMNDAYWAASMQSSEYQKAIPLLYGIDAIHGNNNVLGATVFPHNIGLGAANDPELIKRIAQVTAREILAAGVEWTFAPTLAVAQNPQWGRTYESYSEDPDIVGAYAGAFVHGMQSELGDDSVIACVKHWVGDGGTTHGIDQGETTLSQEKLARMHIAPYLPALDAGVLTVMASFNSWNGDKCHGHRYLLTELLKEKLGFHGFIISDWDGIDYLSKDYFKAVGIGVNAGIDMFMVSEEWRKFIEYLTLHVEQGSVPMARINDAVRRILRVKVAYGLFEKPQPAQRPWANDAEFGGAAHRSVAQEAVRKSLVLLKNQNDLLPLRSDARILVAGKNADNLGHQCGGFTVAWQGTSGNESIEGGRSIWQGIKQVATRAELHASGDDPIAPDFDVAIVVIGETPYAEGLGDIRHGDDVIVEAGSQIRGEMKVLEPYGNSLELSKLHPEDLQLIEAIQQQNIPIVAVLISGRPLVVNQEMSLCASFVAAWLPGSEGQGVAEVLFGEHDFQGRLSFSWPNVDSVAIQGKRPSGAPLFPVGYGLNYSQVEH